ncbi:MAG: hypothetical protein GY795_06175 [Desulfobacterales bacterium]|nr:hypothetical protein [Desulfobacterales bacterium]
MVNPFREIIVQDPWNPVEIDISEINAQAFDLCCDILEIVRTETRTTSVLLYGEAGNGKTHLLGRLREHLKTVPRLHVFVSVPLRTSPRMLWRHLRKSFVESLMKPVEGDKTQLDLICLHKLSQMPAHHNKRDIPSIPMPRLIERLDEKTGFLQKLDKLLRRFQNPSPQIGILETFCYGQGISRNLCKAFEHILLKRHVMDAVAWLKGDSLPESVMKKLNLTHDNENPYDQEYQSREIIKELCHLASPAIPIVLCFDQIEALERYEGDKEGVFIFGQAVRSLHDETSNVLLVSCIQSFFLKQLKNAVTKPDYAAIAIHQATLNPLTVDQSLKLARARLDICPGLDGIKKNKMLSGLEKELSGYAGTEGRTARQVLSYCADLFDSWETGHIKPGLSDENFLNEERTKREKQVIQHMAPERTDGIIRSILPVLANLMDKNWKEQDNYLPRDIEIILEKPGSKVGISLCSTNDKNKLTYRFKRLREQFKENSLNDLVIIRHSQLGLKSVSETCKKYLEDLKKQKAKIIEPDNELLAVLDALRSLIADASAGDLANRGRTVDSETVRDWLKKHLSGSVRDFLTQVTGSDKNDKDNNFKVLMELLDKEHIIKLDDAAKKLGTDTDHLRIFVQQYPEQIGYLEGPPPVIFHFIHENTQTD